MFIIIVIVRGVVRSAREGIRASEIFSGDMVEFKVKVR